jgi:hypothetical protein
MNRWSVHVLTSRPFERFAFIALIGIGIGWFALYPVASALNALIFAETLTADGPFQLLNALRRIAAGSEFQYFHGKGTAWLHYPLYALFGHSLNALQVSRAFTPMLLYVGGMISVALVGLKGRRSRLLFVVVMLAYSLNLWCIYIVAPAHSNLGARSIMPLMVFAALLLPYSLRKALLVGAALGLALAVSTEQGIAITASYVGLSLCFLILKRASFKANARFLIVSLAALAMSFILVTILLSGGWEQALRTIRYNFTEVTGDQVWYFGVPPNPFAASPDYFGNVQFLLVFMLGGGLAALLALRLTVEQRSPFDRSALFASLVFVAYGFVALSGWVFSYTAFHLMQPLMRSIVVCVTLLVLRRFDAPDERSTARQRRLGTAWALIGACLLLLSDGGYILAARVGELYRGIWYASTEPGKRLSAYWEAYQATTTAAIDAASTTETPEIWAVYSGFLHNHYAIFNPGNEDYIIEALGTARRARYVERFSAAQTQFFELPRAEQFVFYQWLLNESWQFFELAFTNYAPLVETPHSWVMMRSDGAWQPLPTACETYPIESDTFTVPERWLPNSALPRILTATLTYETENAYARIPLIGGLPRYFVSVEGGFATPVSLPPRAEQFTFPVVLTQNAPTNIVFSALSLSPGAALHARQLCLRDTAIPEENIRLIVVSLDQ